MAIYTVHVPPGAEPSAERAEKVRFVKDGFALWALLLPPVWLVWRRLWLGLLLWFAAVLALDLLGRLAGDPVGAVAGALFAVFFALEARSLERWTLGRRGYRFAGVVEGPDRETAERRFFETWTGAPVAPPAPPALPAPAPARTVPPGPVIGLFPSPKGR